MMLRLIIKEPMVNGQYKGHQDGQLSRCDVFASNLYTHVALGGDDVPRQGQRADAQLETPTRE